MKLEEIRLIGALKAYEFRNEKSLIFITNGVLLSFLQTTGLFDDYSSWTVVDFISKLFRRSLNEGQFT